MRSFKEADSLNIPVCINITVIEGGNSFCLTADNYHVESRTIQKDVYGAHALSREVLHDLVKKHVVPLYKAALKNLNLLGENEEWSLDYDLSQ